MMPMSERPETYEHLRKYLDEAITSPNGISITFASTGKAISVRQQLYKLRQLDRKKSMEIWNPGDLLYGTSVYDDITIIIVHAVLYIKPGKTPEVNVL